MINLSTFSKFLLFQSICVGVIPQSSSFAVIPCNILNNCDSKARCEYSLSDQGFRCRCLDGYVGDGMSCRPDSPCNDNPGQCHRNAECVQDPTQQSYRCQCKENFVGDGLQCLPTANYDGDHIVFSQGMSILRLPLTPSEVNPGQLLLTKSGQTPVGLDVDCLQEFIYWTDVAQRTIRRSMYNGSASEILLTDAKSSPEGISIDWISQNIYWTDTRRDVINVARLNAIESTRKTLISEGLHDPRDIAVHPELGRIYWTDWHRSSPRIESSNSDGSDRTNFIDTDLSLPNMLAIDFRTHDICWTDAGHKRIECANLNGENRRVVFTPAEYPFGLAIAGDYLFWSDWKANTVMKVHRNGGELEALTLPPGGNGKVYDVVTIPKDCPQMSNACASENGGCRHLCLPNGKGGRTCACPDGTKDSRNNASLDINSQPISEDDFCTQFS